MSIGPPGFMPRGGAGGQSLGHLKNVYFYKSVLKISYADSLSDMAQLCDIDLWVMKWRSAWPIFHGSVILPYILKTIWCMNMIVWDNGSVWPDVWPQNKRSLWPIFQLDTGERSLPFGLLVMVLLSWFHERTSFCSLGWSLDGCYGKKNHVTFNFGSFISGFLLSALSWMCLLGFMNIFFQSRMIFDVS